jgi:hypothetical protein
MSNETTDAIESIDLTDPRAVRALTECMTVLEIRGADSPDTGLYEVVAQSGQTYTVDIQAGRCTCPDVAHNLRDGARCKHQYRVLVATGGLAIPTWTSAAAVDPLLGHHLTAGPRVALADGGTDLSRDASHQAHLDPRGDRQTRLDHEPERERPEDCDCDPLTASGGLPCWPCFRDGFEEPAPEAVEAGKSDD